MGESVTASINRQRDPIPSASANPGANASRDRSMSEVLKDIVETIQKMVRGEVRLAKAEVREEAAKAWKPVRLVVGGAILGLLAAIFLLHGVVYALTLAIPAWAAAGSVGLTLAIAAGIIVSHGAGLMERAFNTLKEGE